MNARSTGTVIARLALVVVATTMAGCSAPGKPDPAGNAAGSGTSPASPASPAAPRPAVEIAPRVIPMRGPVAGREAEISGLAWYRDELILLPQYPGRFPSAHDGVLFAIAEPALRTFLHGAGDAEKVAIEPRTIELVAPGLFDRIADLQGVEAIAFWGDDVFLTIEAGEGNHMTGYLVAGRMAPDRSRITLDIDRLATIPARAPVTNASEETLLVTRDRVITIFEANGKNINPSPVAHVFDHQLEPLGTMPFPAVEYRITDATTLDDKNRFWAINYFFPGDAGDYRPASDDIARRHGQGATHRTSRTVERLLELEYRESGLVLVDRAPIQLALDGSTGRNWEGLARWNGHGFLIITDMFPRTIFAFVPHR